MKRIINLLSIAIILIVVASAQAQNGQTVTVTNMPSFSSGLQTIYDSLAGSTNWGGSFGYFRATSGNKCGAYGMALYNFNSTVGAVIGYDYLWSGRLHTDNLVKGGLNLQADLAPLKQFGLTNFIVTPFAYALVASGSGQVSEVIGGGAKTQIFAWANGIAIDALVIYENRTGAGYWDGRYVGGGLAVTYRF